MWSGHPNPTSGSRPGTSIARNCFGLTRRFQMTPRSIPDGASEAAKLESVFTAMDPSTHGLSGSVWPLDSFMLATPAIGGEVVGAADFIPYGKLHLTATAIAHTYPAGELMMVPWDPIIFTGSTSNGAFQTPREGQHFTHHTASKGRTTANRTDAAGVADNDFDSYIMPKYVYSVATSAHLGITNITRTGSPHVTGGAGGPLAMIAYSPGGPTTRPPWTAYHRRYDVANRLNAADEVGQLIFQSYSLIREVHSIILTMISKMMLKEPVKTTQFLLNIKTVIMSSIGLRIRRMISLYFLRHCTT